MKFKKKELSLSSYRHTCIVCMEIKFHNFLLLSFIAHSSQNHTFLRGQSFKFKLKELPCISWTYIVSYFCFWKIIMTKSYLPPALFLFLSFPH